MPDVKRGPEYGRPAWQDGEERDQEVAEERAADGPPDQARECPASAAGRRRRRDDAGVVDDRPDRRDQELLARVQDAHHQAAQEEEHLGGQQDARQRHGKR